MSYLSPTHPLFNGHQGSMTCGYSKDSGTVATEDESRFSSYQSSDSSNGTDGLHSPSHDDNNNFTRYQQIDEESSCSSGEVSVSSGEYSTTSSDVSSGWDEDMDKLMDWVNDTIVRPNVRVQPWMRAQVDGTDWRTRALPNSRVQQRAEPLVAGQTLIPKTDDDDEIESIRDKERATAEDTVATKRIIHQGSTPAVPPSPSAKTVQAAASILFRSKQQNISVLPAASSGQATTISQQDSEEYDDSDDYSDYSESDESLSSGESQLESHDHTSRPEPAMPAPGHTTGIHHQQILAQALHAEQATKQSSSSAPRATEMNREQQALLSLASRMQAMHRAINQGTQSTSAQQLPPRTQTVNQIKQPASVPQIPEMSNRQNRSLQSFLSGARVDQREPTQVTQPRCVPPLQPMTRGQNQTTQAAVSSTVAEQVQARNQSSQRVVTPRVAGMGSGQTPSTRRVDSAEPTASSEDVTSSDDDSASDDSSFDESTWSIDETEFDEHKKFVSGELKKKKDYGGWKSLSSTNSACSSLSDLSGPRHSGTADAPPPPFPIREVSSPSPDVVAEAARASAARALPESNHLGVPRGPSRVVGQRDRRERRSSMGRFGYSSVSTLGSYAPRPYSERQVGYAADATRTSYGGLHAGDASVYTYAGDDSLEFSQKVELEEPVDYDDISDPHVKKLSERLFRKLNQDPWDEFNKYRDDDVCDFIRLHPEICKVRYVFEHFSSKLFPLSMLSTLGASRHTMELVYEAFQDAINEKDMCIGTPLHYAATYKAKPSVVEFLAEVEPGMLRSINQFGRTPLHMACLFKAPSKTVTFLLHEYPFAAETADKDGYAPLHLACEHGANNEVIRRLVAVNSNVCLALTKDGSTPLHLACSNGASRATTRALVQANPEAAGYQDEDGKTPLHMAAQANAPLAIIDMLVKASPESVSKKSNRGQTALRIAKQRKAPFAVQKLLSA